MRPFGVNGDVSDKGGRHRTYKTDFFQMYVWGFGGSKNRTKNRLLQFANQILIMTIIVIVLIWSLYMFLCYICIIVMESELYRIFVLLLCQLLPKSGFFSQTWLCGLGWGSTPPRRKKSTWSSCGRVGVELELAVLIRTLVFTSKIMRNNRERNFTSPWHHHCRHHLWRRGRKDNVDLMF